MKRIAAPKKTRIRINSTEFGSITVGGKRYEHDVMVTWQGKVKAAQTETRHLLGELDFLKLLFERPDVVVVGTGQHGDMKVGEGVKKFAKQKRIKVIARQTPVSLKEFNRLSAGGRHVVAYMHVTC